jgi:glycosyltransferase domain-containing protein
MNLENVTVIIPAHNRPERLRRLLHYYNSTNIRMVVPDSSENIFPDVDKYPDIIYFHEPHIHFLKKIHKTLPFIKTKYVFFCAEDDFIVPQAIEKIMEYLDEHDDYYSAQGHFLTFEARGRKVEFTPRYIRHFDKDYNADTATGRLIEFQNPYASLLYSVIRSSVFKEMYTNCFDDQGGLLFTNLFAAETYFNYYALIEGKHATLPYFYAARERIAGSATTTTVPFSDIMTKGKYHDERESFLQILANKLSLQDGIPQSEAYEMILKLLKEPYTNKIISKKRQLTLLTEKYKLLKPINKLLIARYKQKGLKAVKTLESYPCSFSTKEKNEIIRHIKMTDL